MTLPPIVFDTDPLPEDLAVPERELGRKAMSLRRMRQSGVRTPQGFTIGADLCRQFRRHGTWPAGVWPRIVAAVRRLERESVQSFDQTSSQNGSLLLAVRSGARTSMPGLLKTRLAVGTGSEGTSPSGGERDAWCQLREAIEDVLTSWDSVAARQYRRSRRIPHADGTAVIIQQMVECCYAGVLWTRSPETPANMIVEAVQGSGDAVVSGRVTPQRWVIPRRGDCQFVGSLQFPATWQRLADHLPDLLRTARSLEQEFGTPLDIEWGLDRAGFVFFQARPIAESPAEIEVEAYRDRERRRLERDVAAGARFWVRHNLSETLPLPSPLSWSLWQQFMSGSGGLGSVYRTLGYRPGKRVGQHSFLTLIAGRIYADPDRATAMFGDAYPLSYVVNDLRQDPAAIDKPPTHFIPERLDPWLLWRLPGMAWQAYRVRRRISKLMKTAADHFENQTVPAIVQYARQERDVDLTELSARELLAVLVQRRKRVMDEFGPSCLLPGTLGGIAYHSLQRLMEQLLGREEATGLCRILCPAGDADLTRRQLNLLATVDTAAGLQRYLDAFGHRAIGEMDLAVPRWRETPEMIQSLAQGVAALERPEAESTLESSKARLLDALAATEAGTLVESALQNLESSWRLLPYRERGKHVFLTGYEHLRTAIEELARRFDLGEDVYYLRFSELGELVDGINVDERMARRRAERNCARSIRLPEVIDGERLKDAFNPASMSGSQTRLDGTGLVGGSATGTTRRPGEFGFSGGQEPIVLLTEALEPALSPLLPQVSAVIVERGGALSHGAILARQFGVPVVRLPDATCKLDIGRRVLVDGTTGRIEVLDEAGLGPLAGDAD